MALKPVGSRAAWKGSAIDYTAEGMKVFSDADIAEIDAGLAAFKASGASDLVDMTPLNFPLPRLAELRRELRFGRGFVLLRGLPRPRYSDDNMALMIYFSICIHLGRPHAQSHQGELLGHVLDVSDLQEAQRGYHKGGSQPFHSDACDVVGLICLRTAQSGGASRIASMAAVHDTMLGQRPDLLRCVSRLPAPAHRAGCGRHRRSDHARAALGVRPQPGGRVELLFPWRLGGDAPARRRCDAAGGGVPGDRRSGPAGGVGRVFAGHEFPVAPSSSSTIAW